MPPKIPRIRGQIEYFTSPYEQRLFSDLLDTKLMMTKVRRKLENVKDFFPGLAIFCITITTGNYLHDKYERDERYWRI